MIWLRSTLFNLCFFGYHLIACIVCIPFLFTPRDTTLAMIRAYLRIIDWMERVIMGIHYEVRGLENLPKEGAYLVAAKHQSPYETFKLHLLFDDPAIVLKKELLSIPIWGRFLSRIDPIAIDRSQGKEAMSQIMEGAHHVKQQGRPIIIFPQGTRVYTHQTPKDRPYKAGVARIQEDTGLPIIPLALNTGAFWPRSGWMKKPGKVVFEFLPAIQPGKGVAETMKELEDTLEKTSNKLLPSS